MQIQKNQMWLAMEPTHPNEHQKTLDETINSKGERTLELSYFTSQKVYKKNLGSWNIKQITNHQRRHCAEGTVPSFTLSHCGFYTCFFCSFESLFMGNIFIMSMHHVQITSGLITPRKRANLPLNMHKVPD